VGGFLGGVKRGLWIGDENRRVRNHELHIWIKKKLYLLFEVKVRDYAPYELKTLSKIPSTFLAEELTKNYCLFAYL
jgi:hypothetical protein